MTETTCIEEKALLYYLECPVRWTGSITVPESPVLACAEHTTRWLIAELCAARTPTANATREFFDSVWKQTIYYQSRNCVPPKKYALRVREGARACRRLRDIIWRSEILQPPSPYALAIGGVMITGEYAVLRSSRRKKHAFALYLRDQGVRIKRLVPDVISFARQLDLGNRLTDALNRDWGIQSFGVLHYWVSRDLSAEHKPGREFAEDVLLGAVGTAIGSPFPVPGDYCRLCPTRACRPDEQLRAT